MTQAILATTPRAIRRFLVDDVLRLATLVAVAAFLLDWATKSWALHYLEGSSMPLGALVLGIERNAAFAFSSGEGVVATELVIAVRVAALLLLIALSRRVGTVSRRYAAGFALLLAGGCGNAADLAFRDGAVVDFIGAGPFLIDWAGQIMHLHFVFNVADVAVLFGLLFIAPLIRRWALSMQRQLARWESRVLERLVSP
jgi:lipoprotein signal peptidase